MKLALVLNENERKERFKVSIEKKKLEENVAPVSEDTTRGTVPGPVLEKITRESVICWNNESSNINPSLHSSIPEPVVIPESNNLLQNSMPLTLSRNSVIFEPEENRSGDKFLSQHLPASYLPIPPPLYTSYHPIPPLPIANYDSDLPSIYKNTSRYSFSNTFGDMPGYMDTAVVKVGNFQNHNTTSTQPLGLH